jgi:hypothetical protein
MSGNPNPTGQSVSSIMDGIVTDADSPALRGIAVTATVGAGTWQASLDHGATWFNIAAVAMTNALLLRSTDQVRFVPAPGVSGVAKLTFRAWDQTSGTAGTKADASIAGGQTSFSSTVLVATLWVNIAPNLS